MGGTLLCDTFNPLTQLFYSSKIAVDRLRDYSEFIVAQIS